MVELDSFATNDRLVRVRSKRQSFGVDFSTGSLKHGFSLGTGVV